MNDVCDLINAPYPKVNISCVPPSPTDPPDEPATLLYASNSGLARLYLNGSVVPGDTGLNLKYAVNMDYNHRNKSGEQKNVKCLPRL